ncbi:MAG: DNA repair protein RecO [Xanthomonadales bacterium]|nr:DNA repair protein RecO [Xanthomonadales bacterium]
MRIEQQPAFVLHSRPYRETSLLLELLTRDHGRLGVVARSVRGERARLRRALLEPFESIVVGLWRRGELATLTTIERTATSTSLTGQAVLAGLYLNELVVRLTGRDDPLPALYGAYSDTVRRLSTGEPMAWTLRRFERDLLQAIGYALPLQHEVESGRALDPAGYYRYGLGEGLVRCAASDPEALRGCDLLALAADSMPDAEAAPALRKLMRRVIRFHLGGAELRSWHVLAMAGSRR